MALHSLRGHPVLLNFFNSQCPDCLDELPTLRQTAGAYRAQGMIVLGVATGGDTLASARGLAVAAHLPYPVVVDEHQDVAWRYNVGGWPISFFLDAQGRVRGQYAGPLDAQAVRNGLAQAGAIHCTQCSALDQPTLGESGASGSGTTLSADTLFSPPRPAAFFALRDQQGRMITPATLRGKVVALTFISAVCKEQCPMVGQTLSLARRDLGRDAAHLAIVAISVDPEQDSPQATRAFAAASGWHGAEWHYLSAPRAVLQRVWATYYVDVPPPPPIYKPGQSIVHQAELFLIDPRGRLRAYYHVPFLASRVASSIRALLAPTAGSQP
jgi:cytochrome oxidase Cu insertion factor (SCO1/SenC/PrrC family)